MHTDFVTILTPLQAHAEEHPDKLLYAFLDSQGKIVESYTYEAFLRRTEDIASHIHRTQTLVPGDRVLLVYPPGLELLCAFFACVRLGLIPVTVRPPSSHGFTAALYHMNYVAQDCEAAAVLTDRSYLWSLRLNKTRASISTLSFKRDYTSRLAWIVTGDAEANSRIDFPEAHSEILFLQYTSGSTSDPKGVIVTHQNVLANCDAVFDHVPVGVSWLPQFHDMGLIGAYLFVGMAGGTTYGISPLDFMQRPSLWLEAMDRYRATVTAAPSFAYQYCLRSDKVADEDLEHLDLSSLQLAMNGAEPVRADVFRGFLRRFGPCGLPQSSFCAAYGLAEYTLAVSNLGTLMRSFDTGRLNNNEARDPVRTNPSNTTEDLVAAGATELVSCGKPLGEVRIVDTSRGAREAPSGRVGEIWVDGPSKCLGYWGQPQLSEQIFEARIDGDGDEGRSWLRTGDLGFMQDGELFVCGRTKDLIIVRGLNYHPQDIERVVEEDPAIRPGCAAAFAVEKDGGEVLIVVAEVRNTKRWPEARGVNRRLQQKLGIVADSFVYIPPRTIPKTSSGKIVRHRARELWLESGLDVVAEVQPATASRQDPSPGEESVADDRPRSASSASLLAMFRRYGLSGSESQPLGEIGLDSLTVAEFALDVEKHLKAQGARGPTATVDLRWLQTIAVSELFGLLEEVSVSAPHARMRFQRALSGLRHEHQAIEREMMRSDARLGLDRSEPGPAPPSGPSPPGSILLTGGTGFLGPFLLKSLLEQTDDEIRVIVRATDRDHATERLRDAMATLNEAMSPSLSEAWERRVRPVCGDLSRPGLGLSKDDWASLSENTHTIYHNGALVNYLLDYASMRSVNVIGTRDLVRLAMSRRAKVLNHISTTFVFGWSSKSTLFESDQNRELELLDFGYSQSKWVSEQIVLNAMRNGLSARVFRPALISPSLSGGGYNFDIAMRLMVFMIKHGIGTTAHNQVSFSPADLVADNIVAISNLADTVGETFHVTRDSHSTMLDITRILGELTRRDFSNYELAEFVPHLIERCGKDDLLFPLRNFLIRSVDNISAMEFKRYDNRNYQLARARSPFGREDPPLEDVVLGIVRFMREHDLIEEAEADRLLERA